LKQQLSGLQKLYDDLISNRDEFADRADKLGRVLGLVKEALLAAKPHVDFHSDMSPISVDKALAAIERCVGDNND
jgi:hypothetical protein